MAASLTTFQSIRVDGNGKGRRSYSLAPASAAPTSMHTRVELAVSEERGSNLTVALYADPSRNALTGAELEGPLPKSIRPLTFSVACRHRRIDLTR